MYPKPNEFDVVLVGGGLANALMALLVLKAAPRRKLALVESGPRLGGNHTWSFHLADVDVDARTSALLDELVEYRWPGYTVSFPRLSRRIASGYASVTSHKLHQSCSEAFERSTGSELVLERRALQVHADRVVLDDGRVLMGDLVVDGRGPERWEPDPSCRYQKFLGCEVTLTKPAPIREPVLMDARVSQREGFRFVYVLPFDERRVLIEDTYFSDTNELDQARLERRILRYAAERGFSVDSIVRRERGCLPLPARAPVAQGLAGPLRSGYQGGWFHPTTGYSFAAAVRLAEFVAARDPNRVMGAELQTLLGERGRQQRYFCLLNRLLYGGFPPEQRYNVLERFYRLPVHTIQRFYAMRTTAGDRARILCGRPPRGLSLSHALTAASAP